ncbi:hypothetical protein KRE40_01580 [Elizabethkingia meningoseptica]|uniref:Uncharacterized protein n=1 Tax=Elizabethkingia meningoseptica TaxID=238 RepID=A0A1V3TXS8_ELIME|nr:MULTISPECIES: hypothetical protein [Elizabethkingia]AQX05473.1 hypothetical protein BBD33_09550 [Elizabethkingia meningoseptica]AQX13026.1 hypothetical protein BBD35_11885 [Elizabethkingia meningoseptica]AQX47516.1 hypothetical protein B5G46_09540 [Elizabethkingia meningoseptica]EJK5328727.1 hypothetical protein [Elizabethkingia meningoseptica]EOR29504.1 hypothetical protein L100_10889 [Elizabethkingia meningoseptica ATCC 13253 = NBRC 12535]
MKKKKREYLSSELVQAFVKVYGLEEKMEAIAIRDFLEEYLDESLYQEITSVSLKNRLLEIRIRSLLLKNDFRMRKSFFLQKFRSVIGEDKISDLQIL